MRCHDRRGDAGERGMQARIQQIARIRADPQIELEGNRRRQRIADCRAAADTDHAAHACAGKAVDAELSHGRDAPGRGVLREGGLGDLLPGHVRIGSKRQILLETAGSHPG